MATKTIKTKVTVGVPGDEPGTVLFIPAGEPVSLDADEADRILARWGGEVLSEETDEPEEVAEPRRRGRPRKF
jgi:hypothetical protein